MNNEDDELKQPVISDPISTRKKVKKYAEKKKAASKRTILNYIFKKNK